MLYDLFNKKIKDVLIIKTWAGALALSLWQTAFQQRAN